MGHERKGSIGIIFLIVLCVMALTGISITAAVSRMMRETASYEKGLQAVYAAEGGAVWGLSFLKKNGIPKEKRWDISLDDGRQAEVYFLPSENSGDPAETEGVLLSRGLAYPSGTARYVKLSFSVRQEKNVFLVTVHQAESEP